MFDLFKEIICEWDAQFAQVDYMWVRYAQSVQVDYMWVRYAQSVQVDYKWLRCAQSRIFVW